MAMLEAKNIGTSFDGLKAIDNFSLTLEENELSGLIGPNGAGKTMIFNLLTGVYRSDRGSIRLDGRGLTGKSIIKVNQVGIARTFQNIRLFSNLLVLDNIKAGPHNHYPYMTLEGILRLPRFRVQEKEMNRCATELLEAFHLEQLADMRAKNLPYGSQWKLEIVRVLATKPKLLLPDEPAAGMNPDETAEPMEMTQLVQKRSHMTILLIEHDMKLVFDICERSTVPDSGKVLKQGETQEVLYDLEVVKAYLGE